MIEREPSLIANADAVVTSSEALRQRWEPSARSVTLIRNAAEVEHFMQRSDADLTEGLRRPLIGYVGAIAEWFDVELIASVAEMKPEWTFVLVGQVTHRDAKRLAQPNIVLHGEKPYAVVPAYVQRFDVCVIPFRVDALTHATDPVKLYEYFAAGKPVVATSLPEIHSAWGTDRVRRHPGRMGAGQSSALSSQTRNFGSVGSRWRARTTGQRASRYSSRSSHSLTRRLSVLIVTWNNLDLTGLCLEG